MKHAGKTNVNSHFLNFFLDYPSILSIHFHDIESCFNDKKDNGEEGFDCGGPCRRKCVGMINLILFL